MKLTRRAWLCFASTVAFAAPIRAAIGAQPARISRGNSTRDYRPVIERVRAFAETDLSAKGFPGMTVALIGPDGFSALVPIGFANVDRGIAVMPDQLFQIGSISKSLVALCLYVLADRGKIDLDSTAQSLLPDHPLPSEPISLVQLLDHSSGLPNGAPPFPPVPGGKLWTGWKPGTHYSYSNLGYELLGAIIEQASGMPFARALETMVLKPLGMATAEPVIRIADRARYATGYVRARDDLNWRPKSPLEPAQWIDWDGPAGSVAASAPDMVRYLAYIVALGRGIGAPLFSDKLARRFVTPTRFARLWSGRGLWQRVDYPTCRRESIARSHRRNAGLQLVLQGGFASGRGLLCIGQRRRSRRLSS